MEYSYEVFPDPFDIYEDMLAAKLGIYKHPSASREEWRWTRVAGIEAAGELADRMAVEVERELDQTDWPFIDRRGEVPCPWDDD